jgi:HD-like signal output (HDOD) protein
MDRIKAKNIIIDKVRSLPTLPDVIHKVLAIVGDEATSAKKLGSLIAYDQAISSRLMKVANSAYYGFMGKIATVQHAIVILGFKEVKSLVLGITVFDTMKESGTETSLIQEDFWMHSMGSALAGQIICKKVGGCDLETTFTASLFHDIGRLVLDVFFTQEFVKVLEKVRVNGANMVEAEEEVMGFSHADVGGWLCERWKFPPALTFPISFHHQVEKADKSHMRMTSIVHLADILCKRANIGNSGDNKIPAIQLPAQEHLKVSEDDLEEIIEQLKQEGDKAKSFLNAIQ